MFAVLYLPFACTAMIQATVVVPEVDCFHRPSAVIKVVCLCIAVVKAATIVVMHA